MFDKKNNHKKKKIGLALGSGGFRGSAHIGVIKALVKNGISIDFIAGSSIGSLVGAHYAIFKDIEKLEKDIIELQEKKYSYLKDLSFRDGLISGKYLIRDFLKMFKGAGFSNTQIPLSIVSTDLNSGKQFIFNKGDLAEAVMASISIPLAFRPFKHSSGALLVDGGISNPVPDDLVRKMGSDFVISVNLYNDYNFSDKKMDLFKIINRATELTLLNLSKNTLRDSDIVINPDSSFCFNKSRFKAYFSKDVFKEIMNNAEKETDKKIKEIKKMLET